MSPADPEPASAAADDLCSELAAEVLRRHNGGDSETDIRSAVRDFIIGTGLAERAAITQETAPAAQSALAVDMVVRDTFIEFKRNLYRGDRIAPDHISQLDGYLTQALETGRGIRNGVLTDGKRWVLRQLGDAEAAAFSPPVWTLESADAGLRLYEWLRDNVFAQPGDNVAPTWENLLREFGDARPESNQDLLTLQLIYRRNAARQTLRVKRRLWEDLLRAALGEIAGSPAELDGLFIRHTYLSAVIGIAVQASFGIDIHDVATREPADLLQGRRLKNSTGLSGIVESDFFAWPVEVAGGAGFIQQLARRLARFNWSEAPPNIAALLYEAVIPAPERRQLGEYYTPQWLAEAMVAELIDDPLTQRALDPACGSGAFVAAAVRHFINAARQAGLVPKATLDQLREAVAGIDVHPAAVHLARAAWALAARPAIAAAASYDTELSAPIYLGDALQLRYRTGDLFAAHAVTIATQEPDHPELVFPMSLVARADTFDALLSDLSLAIETGHDPMLALDDHAVTDADTRATLTETIAAMQRLHHDGRNHIWAYYTRNMVRPVILSQRKVDVIIGNPPWLNYNQTVNILRTELEAQSKNLYDIWVGGRYATHQDVAGLFYARSVDLYLKDGGVIGMVMPHSALQSGQYAKWRRGAWASKASGRGRRRVPGRTLAVNFAHRTAWDLEPLEPNTFFPVAACVVFAARAGENAAAAPLAGAVERWTGPTPADQAGVAAVRRERAAITDTSTGLVSPYAAHARQGASIVPRCLFLVQETENPMLIQAGQTVTVNPRRGAQDKAPWKNLDLTDLAGQPLARAHLYDVQLGETVVPYATLEPLQAALPVRRGEYQLPADAAGPGGIYLGGLERRMRERWLTVSGLWETNRQAATKLNLLGQLDYHRKLSSQLEWQQNNGGRPIRILHNKAGEPTAAILENAAAIIDVTLYWIACKDMQEANYLLAIINSNTLYAAVTPLMPKGQFGARDLHKHLWKLPIPEYDAGEPLHREAAAAGAAAARGAAARLAELRAARGGGLTVTIARRELRAWLRASSEGQRVESAVRELFIRAGAISP